MQNVICDVQQCGARSKNGFCLNRLVKIGADGRCVRLLKSGWEQPLEKWQKYNYSPWLEEQEKEIRTIEEKKEDLDQSNSGKEQPPRD